MKTTDLLNASPLEIIDHLLDDSTGVNAIRSYQYDAILINLCERMGKFEEKSLEYDKLIDRVSTLLPGGIR